jgi:hypothetical protein
MNDEWRHVYRRFRDFINVLRPTPQETDRAGNAAVEVALSLRRRFGAGGGRGLDYLLIGGFGKGTAIRPASTVDLLYQLPLHVRRADSFDGGPLVLLEVAAVLGEDFSSVTPNRGWLTVSPWGDGPAVRVIPAFACATGGFLMVEAGPPAAGSSHWRQINPQAEAAMIQEADRTSDGKATHLILMAKAWRRQHNATLSPFVLELLVAEFVSVWTYQKRSLLFYDWMIRDFFFWLRHQAGRQISIPGTLDSLNLGSSWLGEAETSYLNAMQACLLERDNRNEEAERRWKQIFGQAFLDAPQAEPAQPHLTLVKPSGKTSTG